MNTISDILGSCETLYLVEAKRKDPPAHWWTLITNVRPVPLPEAQIIANRVKKHSLARIRPANASETPTRAERATP